MIDRAPPAVLFLFALLLVLYLANGRSSGDTQPTRYLPFSILRQGTFYLDGLPGFDPSADAVFARRTPGGVVSDYPVGAALLALPIYAPFVWYGVSPEGPWPVRLEKLAAAAIVAASVALFLLVLRRLTDPVSAFALAIVLGVATSNLSTNAQALWHHDATQLGMVAALYCIVRGRSERAWVARAALPLAFALISRPQALLVIAPVAVYVLLQRPGLFRFAAWGLPPVLFHAWYNVHHFGALGRTQFPLWGGLFSMNVPEGLYGVLLSPGRGLFIYSPIFLLSLAGALLVWRRGGDGLLRALAVAIVPTVIFYARYIAWHGGNGYGPRYLGDLNVALTMLLLPLVPWVWRSGIRVGVVAILVTVSAASGAYGAFIDQGERDDTDFVERLWLWNRHPLVGHLLSPQSSAAGPAEPFLVEPKARSDGPMRVELALNGSRLGEGDTLSLGVRAENASPRALDLYTGVVLPRSNVAVFFVSPQRGTTGVPLTRAEWFRPLALMHPGTRVWEPRVFRFTVHANTTPMNVWAFAALVEPRSRPWRVVAADVKPLELRP